MPSSLTHIPILLFLPHLSICSRSLPLCTDFGSLFDLEHDLPDELINSSELGLVNGGDLSQLHTSLGGGMGLGPGGGCGQDAVAKHKQLSELLRSGAPHASTQQGAVGSTGGASMGHLGNMKVSPGPQGMGQQQHLSPQQQASMMQQQAGMVGSMNRGMMGAQKGNGQQQQSMMGGQVMNGSPRMGFLNQGIGGNNNLLAETLQQQQQQGAGGQAGLRVQQPGAMNKVCMDPSDHRGEMFFN